MAAEEGSAEKKKLVGTIFNMKYFWCHSGRSMQILYKHVNNVSQVSAENMQKISKWKTQRQQNKQTLNSKHMKFSVFIMSICRSSMLTLMEVLLPDLLSNSHISTPAGILP